LYARNYCRTSYPKIRKVIMSIDISLIKKALQKPLGEKAQYIMAPQNRAALISNLNKDKLQIASVILILFYQNKDLHCVLLQRAQYKGYHSGQICLPGGKKEKSDKDLLATAIRETFEEINLTGNDYNILGELSPLVIPVSKILVYPFVAFAHNISSIQIDNYEITNIYKIPISFFQNQNNIGSFSKNNEQYPYYSYKKHKIWGATAMIISEFIEIIASKNQ